LSAAVIRLDGITFWVTGNGPESRKLQKAAELS
jgi:hypothetical protein